MMQMHNALRNIITLNRIYFIVFASILTLSTMLSGAANAADPLGFKIGKASYSYVKERLSSVLNLQNQGFNKFSGGKMLIADQSQGLGYDGLEKITLIFDHKDILTAVTMRLKRDENGVRNAGFMYVYKQLTEKYLSNFESLQPMGKMTAGFVTPSRDVYIRMMSRRASNIFDLQYLSHDFYKRYDAAQKSDNAYKDTAQYNTLQRHIF